MIDNPFRQFLDKNSNWLIRFYKKAGVTPNQITLMALLLSCLSAWLIVQQQFLIAIAIWWLGRLLDGTDGIYARATQQESLYGAFLDILSDMASYAIMVLGFSLAFPDQDLAWRIMLFLYVLCITGALSLGSLQEKRKLPPQDNRGLRLAAGLAEGGETGIAYSVFLILPQFIAISVWIWIGFLIVTVISRCLLAYRELRE